jgi:hypothetical protein
MFQKISFSIVVLAALFLSPAFAQTGVDLEKLKLAAESGDAVAQDSLARVFDFKQDEQQSEIWYRKAAGQGFAPAEGQLANKLFRRVRSTVNLDADKKAALGTEAVRWATLAANQGDHRGQADLAEACLDGVFIQPNLVEAYKWGELAAHAMSYEHPAIVGKSVRDAAILKMSVSQLSEARQLVASFVPQSSNRTNLPALPLIQQIALTDINLANDQKLAVINGKAFAPGVERDLTIGGRLVSVKCLEVGENSARVQIQGADAPADLPLAKNGE